MIDERALSRIANNLGSLSINIIGLERDLEESQLAGRHQQEKIFDLENFYSHQTEELRETKEQLAYIINLVFDSNNTKLIDLVSEQLEKSQKTGMREEN